MLLNTGGHGFEVLENIDMIEIKLAYAAQLQGLEIAGSGPWMTDQRPLSASDWYGWLALKKARGLQSK